MRSPMILLEHLLCTMILIHGSLSLFGNCHDAIAVMLDKFPIDCD
ncbi:hypothetical protein [Microcystis sp. M087S2]|nr:hypothetical protein [Microcystis sp. M087S2]